MANNGQDEIDEEPVRKFFPPTDESLLAQLLDMERFVGSAGELRVEDLCVQLASLRTGLLAHFKAEEEHDGPLGDLASKEPRYEREARRLLDEHHQLAEGLETLLEVAATAESVDDPLRAKVRNWISRARWHEAQEDVLLMDAANRDLGAAD